ncbi:protein of unknown function (plasmid) [Rhodovastum atsumiense]|nr:protein of unknown function [Rhodovastum atsumiense]
MKTGPRGQLSTQAWLPRAGATWRLLHAGARPQGGLCQRGSAYGFVVAAQGRRGYRGPLKGERAEPALRLTSRSAIAGTALRETKAFGSRSAIRGPVFSVTPPAKTTWNERAKRVNIGRSFREREGRRAAALVGQ